MDQDKQPASATRLVQGQDALFASRSESSSTQSNRRMLWLGSAGLAVAILAAFWPALQSGFINMDDGEYVLQNPHVATGLSIGNIVWAFTTGHASNWHPLTWLSHMLDVQLFGLNPTGHHLVNLLLHIVNTILLFLLLVRLTGTRWRALAVAGLFGLHPLHVESVVWVSERKDVLSTLFFLGSIWAYAEYAQLLDASPTPSTVAQTGPFLRARAKSFYLFTLLLFALGLMSKPMLVTLPFLLLLLDYWPLDRFKGRELQGQARIAFLKEKLPLFALAAISSVITVAVQQRGHAVKVFLPLYLRLENAVVSYVSYLGKAFWPVHLSIFYPHPNTRYNLSQTDALHPVSEQWALPAVVMAAAFLFGVSLLAFKWRRPLPWLMTGWYWYVGTLVPVIGIVQVGMQSMADRYTYIPLIGIFIAAVWAVATLAALQRSVGPVLAGAVTLMILACGLVTHRQAGFWHDDLTLFQHALSVTVNNAVAESHVGVGLAKQGRLDLAETHFKAALADDPYFYDAHSSMGSLYEIQVQPAQAMDEYRTTLKMRPWDDFAHLHLAGLLHKLGRDDEAIAGYREDLEANPDSVEANYQLGALLLDRGDLHGSTAYLSKAVDLNPKHVDALLCLSDLWMKQGKPVAAQVALQSVVDLYPTNFELRINLASLFWDGGKEAEALEQYREAVRLRPTAPIGHYDLAVAYAAQGKLPDATKELEEAARLKPDYTEALSELAWLLASNPDPIQRNGARSLELARRSLELGATNQPRTWAALDVAYAETGRFTDAIDAAGRAFQLAAAQGQSNVCQAAEERLKLYKNQKPYRLVDR